jgi:hypothetical protein
MYREAGLARVLSGQIKGSNFAARSQHEMGSEEVREFDAFLDVRLLVVRLAVLFAFLFTLLLGSPLPTQLLLLSFLFCPDPEYLDGAFMGLHSDVW